MRQSINRIFCLWILFLNLGKYLILKCSCRNLHLFSLDTAFKNLAGKSGNTAPSASSGLTASTPARSPNSPPIFLTSIYRSLFFLVFSASSAAPRPKERNVGGSRPPGIPSFLLPRAFASSAFPGHPPRPARSSPRARSVRPGLPPPEAEGNLFLPPAPSLPTARRPLPAFPTAPCLPTPRSRRPHIPPSCSMSASTPTAWLQFSPEGIRTRAARYTVERCW